MKEVKQKNSVKEFSLVGSSHAACGSNPFGPMSQLGRLLLLCCLMIAAAGPLARGEVPTTQPASGESERPQHPFFPRVESVITGSAAERAGIQIGDLIITCAGHPTAASDNQAFLRFMRSAKGHTIELAVLRDGRITILSASIPDDQPFGLRFTLEQTAASPAPKPAVATHPLSVPDNLKLGIAAARIARELNSEAHEAPATPTPPDVVGNPPVPEIPPPPFVPEPVAPPIEPPEDGGILENIIEFILDIFGL